jgi:hypothetical protein
MTTSAYDVTSMSRARLPELVIVTRRTSASSSPETTTSRVVFNSPSVREKEARSALKVTA